MKLTREEREMLCGAEGDVVVEAMDCLMQFGEAFGAEQLADVTYCHYPAEMAIYADSVEDAVEYAARGAKVRVPTTTSTLCCDLERPLSTGIPEPLAELQARVEHAHGSMGILDTYTCTPQLLGYTPNFGSIIASVESSAIIYFNSVLGARTNRGGLFTRFTAVTGKYPLMGYLLDENRRGTHLFKVTIPSEKLQAYDAWCALGFHIGSIVGSEVPVITGVPKPRHDWLIGFGAALATSGSATLFHIPGVTPEADAVEDAFMGAQPRETYEVGVRELDAVYEKMNTIPRGAPIDFVTLGCPHYSLEQLRYVAGRLRGQKIAEGVRFWVCTNRIIRRQAEALGYARDIEGAGALVVADTCPVESHMRQSTCREYGLKTPNVEAMVTDSVKMARYCGDLIGCKTALVDTDTCIRAAISGRWE